MRTIRRTLAEIDVEGKLLPDGTFCVYVTSDPPVFSLLLLLGMKRLFISISTETLNLISVFVVIH